MLGFKLFEILLRILDKDSGAFVSSNILYIKDKSRKEENVQIPIYFVHLLVSKTQTSA